MQKQCDSGSGTDECQTSQLPPTSCLDTGENTVSLAAHVKTEQSLVSLADIGN